MMCQPVARYFYPRSPCGERLHYDNYNLHCVEISIHALLAESDCHNTKFWTIHQEFLSTLSLRRATNNLLTSVVSSADFYPRSPCGERLGPLIFNVQPRNFYPRSPCGERLFEFWTAPSLPLFLSTLSLRRATILRMERLTGLLFLSTLSLRRATAPSHNPCLRSKFLSTLSLRRATKTAEIAKTSNAISIHALLAESDILGRGVVV